jgi:hypothetical protein
MKEDFLAINFSGALDLHSGGNMGENGGNFKS